MPKLRCPICLHTLVDQRALRSHLTSKRHSIMDKEKLLLMTNLSKSNKIYVPYEGGLAKQTDGGSRDIDTDGSTKNDECEFLIDRTIEDVTLGLKFSSNHSGAVVVTKVQLISPLFPDAKLLKGARISKLNDKEINNFERFTSIIKSIGSCRPITISFVILTNHETFIDQKKKTIKQMKIKNSDDNLPALLKAAKNNNVPEIHNLILSLNDKPENITDRHGSNALHYAAGYVSDGSIDAVRVLLSYGIKVDSTNQIKEKLSCKASSSIGSVSRTAFHWACRNGNIEIAKYLISQGADCRKRTSDGTSALHWAFWNKQMEVCKWLLGVVSWMNPRVNESNKFDCTSAHFIGLNGDVACAQLFINYGGKLFKKNNQKHSIIHKASWRGRLELIEFIRKYMVDTYGDQGLDIFHKECMYIDGNGYTPQDVALLAGHHDLIEWFTHNIPTTT